MKLFIMRAFVFGAWVSASEGGAQAVSSGSILEPLPPSAPVATRVAPLPFRPGIAIRVKTASNVIEGRLATSSHDTVFVHAQEGQAVTAISTSTIVAIEVQYDDSEKRSRLLRGMGIGAAFGGMAGGLIGASIPVKDPCPTPSEFCFDFSGLDVLANTGLGILIGGALGALVGGGVANEKSSGWQPFPVIRVAAAPTWRLGRPTGAVAALRLSLP